MVTPGHWARARASTQSVRAGPRPETLLLTAAAEVVELGREPEVAVVDGVQLRELTNEPVPNHMKRWWFALGGTPAYLFVVQIATGILLAFTG